MRSIEQLNKIKSSSHSGALFRGLFLINVNLTIMERLKEEKKELNRETNGTRLLSKDATSQEIEKAKKEFLDYVSDESGVKWE